jgi:hypothetical protein
VRWAIVIGIDEYGGQPPTLQSAVSDAVAFRRWLIETAGLESERITLLLGRPLIDGDHVDGELPATRDTVFNAIGELMAKSEGSGESLWFFFSGHGVTAEWANREESALVFPGADAMHQSQTLAVRSVTEFFETTQLEDQFFFIDACRSPLEPSHGEIGPWQIPRRRDPGQSPVQQFILYATSPGRTAAGATWPNELSAFSKELMAGLGGDRLAKAWSWDRRRYEVRWERLADYVKARMEQKRNAAGQEYAFQIPQDVGTRGVAGRDRDAVIALPPAEAVQPVSLTLDLSGESSQLSNVTVEDALGVAVATAMRVSGAQQFALPPRTYAATVASGSGRIGRLIPPVELYDAATPTIFWQDKDEPLPADPYAPGTITIESPDPLAVADIRDETGRVAGIATRVQGCATPPGFYRVRLVAPERETMGESQVVLLRGGETKPAELSEPAVDARTAELAGHLGGSSGDGYVTPSVDAAPAVWAQPSTVVVSAMGSALQGDRTALGGLGLDEAPATGIYGSGVAFFAVLGSGLEASLEQLRVRLWRAGDEVPENVHALRRTDSGIASFMETVETPEPYWLSLETDNAEPTVVALPLLSGCIATVVLQVDSDRVKLYQFHPVAQAIESSTPDALRRLEHLQRQLLGGRFDGAESLVAQVREGAQSDPFGACLAGYVMLRLGLREGLGGLASAIVGAAPRLSDGYILRGEYEAYARNDDAMGQAFADAVNAGVPAFAEGLTRLVEGLRASGFVHPRGALVRYIFQRHVRGSMWAAFTPRRRLRPGRLVITGADVGYEG